MSDVNDSPGSSSPFVRWHRPTCPFCGRETRGGLHPYLCRYCEERTSDQRSSTSDNPAA